MKASSQLPLMLYFRDAVSILRLKEKYKPLRPFAILSCRQKALKLIVILSCRQKAWGSEFVMTPPTIQLTFEHKIGDQDLGQDAFYTASRDNRCVVCASKTHLLRYRVSPACNSQCMEFQADFFQAGHLVRNLTLETCILRLKQSSCLATSPCREA